jgi:rubrerythrin
MFNADEILAIAVKIERNAQAFYGRAAEAVSAEPIRALFRDLAKWEVSHERLFSAMRDKFAAQQAAAAVMDPDGEAAKYLQAIADGEIFAVEQTEADLATMGDDPANILATAIQREKDSVVFYLAMKEMVPASLGRGDIDKIIAEEMSHVRFLSAKAREL